LRGDELIGHGHTNSDRQADLSEAQERELLLYCRNRINKESKVTPLGWLSPRLKHLRRALQHVVKAKKAWLTTPAKILEAIA